MPYKCYVPGCKSGYVSKKEENERAGIRNPSIFSAPKDEQLLEEWRQLIPRSYRDFSSKDKVCELHFEDECVVRDYVNLKPDGSLFQIPKGHVTLKKGSIPTIFQNLWRKKRQIPASRACFSKIKQRKSDNFENVADNPLHLNDYLENVTDNSLQSKVNFGNINDISQQLNDNFGNAVVNTPSQLKDFYKFSVEIKNMMTPSWWSVANTEDFVMFVKWNSKYCSERRLIICKDLSIKVFLKDVEVSLPAEECTVENISRLLKRIDDFKICKNADSRTSPGCLGFVEGKRQVFCSTCTKSIKNKKDVERRRFKKSLEKQKKDILQEIKNIKRRNSRLQDKVVLLKSELAQSRYECSKAKKKTILEAIAHLPIQDQIAIESCLFGSKNASIEIKKENNSDLRSEDLSTGDYSEDSISDSDENASGGIKIENNSDLRIKDLFTVGYLEDSISDSDTNRVVEIKEEILIEE